MAITSAQCRAARGLLNWTQDELARRVGVSVRTIRDFEAEKRQPHNLSLRSIEEAFEEGGVAFFDNDGVKRKS